MRDDQHRVCQQLTGADRVLKGRGSVLAAVRFSAEVGDKDGLARLCRSLGIEERRMDNRQGNECKKDDYKKAQIFHGGKDRETKLKIFYDETLRIRKKNFTFMLYQTRPD